MMISLDLFCSLGDNAVLLAWRLHHSSLNCWCMVSFSFFLQSSYSDILLPLSFKCIVCSPSHMQTQQDIYTHVWSCLESVVFRVLLEDSEPKRWNSNPALWSRFSKFMIMTRFKSVVMKCCYQALRSLGKVDNCSKH